MRKYFGLLCLVLTASSCFSQQKYPATISNTTVSELVSNKQVLLTNYARFKGYKTTLEGASSFLINYNNKVYAVTAKHLLGPAMGIEPEVKTTELKKHLAQWRMFPRVAVKSSLDTVLVKPGELLYDSLKNDILMLEVATLKTNTTALTPNFSLPEKGDKLYLIGCPYSQSTCRQNIYEVVFDSYDPAGSVLNCIIETDVVLTGFSGAPIVDSKGNVVAVLITGGSDGKTKYVFGTSIKEIQKIKYAKSNQ
ncbi:MAG: trypsin-like peptidase domain-containing protein [Bacteroidota bacterium]